MTNRRMTLTWLLILMLCPTVLSAQTFEGTIKQRTIQVSTYMLQELLWAEEEEPEYDSEAEYNAAVAKKLFAIPMARLEAMGLDGSADISQSTIYIKGSRMRMAGESEDEGFMLFDFQNGTYQIVNPQEQTYLEFSRDEMEQQRRASEDMLAQVGVNPEETGEMSEGEVKVQALGLTEHINGFQASAYEADDGERIGRGWCAEDEAELVKTFEAFETQASFDEEEGDDFESLLCEGRVPILLQVFEPFLGSYDVTEILAIDRSGVSDSLFEIPAGFKRVSMGEMWQ